MKRILLFLLIIIFYTIHTAAQSATDVIRYSAIQSGGSARFVGAGGAFGALGAEFGGLSQNPAGLAMFRTDEFMVTPSIRLSKSASTLVGNPAVDDDKSSFAFDNIGLVFNTVPRDTNWKTFNVAIGLNRQANYTKSYFYEGDAAGTIMNGFFNDAKSVFGSGGTAADLDGFGSGLAYAANAIYADSLGNITYDFASNPNQRINRQQVLNNTGRMNELVFSMAGNLADKLMVGMTVGVPFVKFGQEGEYLENDKSGNVEYFDKLAYSESLRTDGVGVNLKLGVIYKVSQALRLGAAMHTPTVLALTDRYSNSFSYSYSDASGVVQGSPNDSPEGTFDYRLRTPWRASGSAAVVIRKIGFLSADFEFVDYSANVYNFTKDNASNENKAAEKQVNLEIQKAMQQAMNVRLGGELALNEFRLRGGLSMLGKPEKGETGFNMAYSAGAGIRKSAFYLDLAWRRTNSEGSIYPYAGAPKVTTANISNDILLTLGFKF